MTGTVGCVCMFHGHVAAATSTGGLTNKMAGRVGMSDRHSNCCSSMHYLLLHVFRLSICCTDYLLRTFITTYCVRSSLDLTSHDSGDTSIIGAGTYANDQTCAVSATGKGEEFMRAVAAYDCAGKGHCLIFDLYIMFIVVLCMQYITLHYITLHYIALHYITLHYITLHYITLHYITLHYVTHDEAKRQY